MGAWSLLVRTDLRRRWSAVVALSLLVGLAGAFVLTAAVGARRADSALDRFLDVTEMWDGSIEVDFPAKDVVLDDVRAQPEVAAASAAMFIPLVSDETGVIAGLGTGWLRDVYRPRIIAGRLPDPTHVDELLVNEETAERHDLALGGVVVLEDYLGLGISQRMTIVGIHRGVIDLALADTYPGGLATEAFGRRFAGRFYDVVAGTPDVGLIRPQIVVRMRGDVEDPARVLDAVADRHPTARPQVADQSAFVSPLARSLAVQVEAFWILTAVSAASMVLLVGIALARLASSGSHPHDALRALGLPSGARAMVAIAGPAIVVTVGLFLAVGGAIVASPLVPLGSARRIEPRPGIWLDPVTLLIGAAVIAIGLAGVGLGVARLDLRHARRAQPSRSVRRLPLTVILGRDLAFRQSRWGAFAVVATSVGVCLIVSVSVYSASRDHLIASPSLFGSDYDALLFPEDGVEPEKAFADIDLNDPTIESAAISRVARVTVAGDLLEAQVIDRVRGTAGGTVLRGREPRADDEVALGPATAKRLDVGVGDELVIIGSRKRSMRIVGEALLPLQGQAAFGDVMWLAPGAAAHLEAETAEPRLLLGLADGSTQDDLGTAIGDSGETVAVPDDVTNLDGVGNIPALLAIFGGLLGGAVLAFALLGIVQRRRRDLAILRVLGLPPRVVRRAVLTACLIIVSSGAAIGIATGVVLGRAYWSAVATGVPALPQPVAPLAAIALVILGTLVVGGVLAFAPARLAAHARPAEVLHRE